MEEYGLSEQGAGYAFGILIAAFGVGCVLGGFLQDSEGPRCAALWGHSPALRRIFAAAILPGGRAGLFLAFSIPAGLGTAFLYPSIQSCAQKWYAGRRGLPPASSAGRWAFRCVPHRVRAHGGQRLWDRAGHPGRVLGAGGLTLPSALRAVLLLDPPESRKTSRGGKNEIDLSPWQMLKTKAVLAVRGARCVFSTPAVLLFSPIILKLGMERGLDETLRCGAWCWAAWAVRRGAC